MSDPRNGYEALGVTVAGHQAIAIIPVMIVARGFTLMILWGWFITPAFAISAPSLPLCIGLGGVAYFVTNAVSSSQKTDPKLERPMLHQCLLGFFGMGLVLLIGYITHLFV